MIPAIAKVWSRQEEQNPSLQSILKLVKLQCLVVKCCTVKCGNIAVQILQFLYTFVLCAEIM
jgi:hypothetical protein